MSFVLVLSLMMLSLPVVHGCGRREDSTADGGAAVPGKEWESPGGRWHMLHEGDMTEEQKEEIKRLKSIGYVTGSEPAPETTGITVYDSTLAYAGLNFFTSGHVAGAVLMDMRGNVLHEWTYRFIDAWKTGPREELPKSTKGAGYWRRAHLFENGDVLAIFEGMALVKIDSNSDLLWAHLGGTHHDLDVADDGRIYVLTREAHMVPRINTEKPILEDYILILDANGEELERISVLEAFERSQFTEMIDNMKDSGDIFHTNTIEILDGSMAGRVEGFDRGNVLVCPRELDTIAVVDLELRRVVWALSAPWEKPHQPTVLPNGNIMLFDNKGYWGSSRVMEFDPLTQNIAWVYHGEEPRDFYSRECGSNQRLPNGNTLITESDRGRAFEVTPNGTIVWEYVNPAKAGENQELIATVFEMIRLPADFPVDWSSGI